MESKVESTHCLSSGYVVTNNTQQVLFMIPIMFIRHPRFDQATCPTRLLVSLDIFDALM
jgi:hypothetical protein